MDAWKAHLGPSAGILALIFLLTLLPWVALPLPSHAVVLYVSDANGNDNYPCGDPLYACKTIQRAVNVAASDDQIWVAAGTYVAEVLPVVLLNKNLSITGGYDNSFTALNPQLQPTVLDGRWQGPVVVVNGADHVSLHTLKITRGNGSGGCGSVGLNGCGGGIRAVNAQVNVSGCEIAYNKGGDSGTAYGGGIFVQNGYLNLSGSRVHHNTGSATMNPAEMGGGGGVYVLAGRAVIMNNEIDSNFGGGASLGSGGGLYLEGLEWADILNNNIHDNVGGSVGGHGGGLRISNSATVRAVQVKGNVIQGNAGSRGVNSGGIGGGIYLQNTEALISANRFFSNSTGTHATALRWGGAVGIQAIGQTATLTNNIFANNESSNYGGAVGFESSYTPFYGVLLNNTIAQNGLSAVWGGGNGQITLKNNIVSGHAKGLVKGGGNVSVSADYNLYFNTTDPIIGANPVFGDPLLTPLFELSPGSPAIDAGLTLAEVPKDIKGTTRPIGLAYDLGAVEYLPRLFLPIIIAGIH